MVARQIRKVDGWARFVAMAPGILLGLATLLLAWSAASDAIVGVTRGSVVRVALARDATDPLALASKAEMDLLKCAPMPKSEACNSRVAKLARSALTRQNLNPKALMTLALVSPTAQEGVTQEEFVALANRVSRRQFSTQLWYVEAGIERNDIPAVLRQYDAMLRVHKSAEAFLYPRLTNALLDPAIAKGFDAIFRERPVWLPAFLNYATVNSPDPSSIYRIVRAGGGLPNDPTFGYLQEQLVRVLVDKGHFSEARDLLGRLVPDSRRITIDVNLSGSNTLSAIAPMSWDLDRSNDFLASFVRRPGDVGAIHVGGPPEIRGVVARKLLYLPPGSYRFFFAYEMFGGDAGGRANWMLNCANGSVPSLLWSGQIFSKAQGEVKEMLSVPERCPQQFLELYLISGENQSGIDVEIFSPSLQKAS